MRARLLETAAIGLAVAALVLGFELSGSPERPPSPPDPATSMTDQQKATSDLTMSPRLDPLHVDLASVTPQPAKAHRDRPAVERFRCHTQTDIPRICTFGDGTKVMVAFGDSHMAQWFGALRHVAQSGGYRLLWATKPGCPAADVLVPFDECMRWRDALLRKVAALPRVDLAVIASSSWITMLRPGTTTIVPTADERAQLWGSGMAKTVRRIKETARRIVVIRDTPRLWINAPDCLRASDGDTRPCSQSRSTSLQPEFWQVEKALERRFARVRAVQFSSSFCAPQVCRPVTRSLLLRFRDDSHLTNTFSLAMSDTVGRRFRSAFG